MVMVPFFVVSTFILTLLTISGFLYFFCLVPSQNFNDIQGAPDVFWWIQISHGSLPDLSSLFSFFLSVLKLPVPNRNCFRNSMNEVQWPLLGLFSILIILALFGNLLVCAAILWDRSLRKQPENLFLVSLAVSDLLVSVLVSSSATVYGREIMFFVFFLVKFRFPKFAIERKYNSTFLSVSRCHRLPLIFLTVCDRCSWPYSSHSYLTSSLTCSAVGVLENSHCMNISGRNTRRSRGGCLKSNLSVLLLVKARLRDKWPTLCWHTRKFCVFVCENGLNTKKAEHFSGEHLTPLNRTIIATYSTYILLFC